MVANIQERDRERVFFPVSLRGWVVPGILLVALSLVVGWAIGLYDDTQTPGGDSADAGFARDMSIHHAQAVEMALIVRDRTDDDQIRAVATDMMLTQQNQIGRMEGWLSVWDLPMTGDEPPMAWMGHEVNGRMPGMASQEEVDQLRTLPIDEMNVQFLRLMIVHHQAGVDMAEAVLDRSDRSEVVALAGSIIKTQQAEIDLMNDFLTRLGAPTVDPVPAATPTTEHGHDD